MRSLADTSVRRGHSPGPLLRSKQSWALGALAVIAFCLTFPVKALDVAQALFAAHHRSVLQVQVLDLASDSKSSIGSGFWATADGHVVTNFHVIADVIHDDAQHRAEYLLESGEKGNLSLVGIDVVHDLAVLKTARPATTFLTIDDRLPANGERLFAMGNPQDLGLSIVEGTYNGLIEESLYEKIHFTGALNPGMSGGPTINRAGRVVGVNVATGGDQLGFLVPAKHVAQLLERVVRAPPEEVSFTAAVGRQLFDNQARYMRDLIAALPNEQTQIDGFHLPGRLTPYFRCWGDTDKAEKQLYTRTAVSCYTDDDIFLTDDHEVGEVKYIHEYYTTNAMGPLRFHAFLEEQINTPHLSIDTDEEIVGNYRCRTRLVQTDSLVFKLVFCVRRYKKLDTLYDAFVTAVTRTEMGAALQTSFTLSGVSYDSILAFLDRYLQAITWTK